MDAATRLKRRALVMLTVELSNHMNPGVLGPYLFQKRLLSKDEFERLNLPIMTHQDKNLFILQRIPNKGPHAFDLFIECLRDSGEVTHTELADSLTSKLDELTVTSTTSGQAVPDIR